MYAVDCWIRNHAQIQFLVKKSDPPSNFDTRGSINSQNKWGFNGTFVINWSGFAAHSFHMRLLTAWHCHNHDPHRGTFGGRPRFTMGFTKGFHSVLNSLRDFILKISWKSKITKIEKKWSESCSGYQKKIVKILGERAYMNYFSVKKNAFADFQISDFFQNFWKFAPPALLAVWTRNFWSPALLAVWTHYRRTLKE